MTLLLNQDFSRWRLIHFYEGRVELLLLWQEDRRVVHELIILRDAHDRPLHMMMTVCVILHCHEVSSAYILLLSDSLAQSSLDFNVPSPKRRIVKGEGSIRSSRLVIPRIVVSTDESMTIVGINIVHRHWGLRSQSWVFYLQKRRQATIISTATGVEGSRSLMRNNANVVAAHGLQQEWRRKLVLTREIYGLYVFASDKELLKSDSIWLLTFSMMNLYYPIIWYILLPVSHYVCIMHMVMMMMSLHCLWSSGCRYCGSCRGEDSWTSGCHLLHRIEMNKIVALVDRLTNSSIIWCVAVVLS